MKGDKQKIVIHYVILICQNKLTFWCFNLSVSTLTWWYRNRDHIKKIIFDLIHNDTYDW
jgi:hypothetical protein